MGPEVGGMMKKLNAASFPFGCAQACVGMTVMSHASSHASAGTSF